MKSAGLLAALSDIDIRNMASVTGNTLKTIRITNTDSSVEREKLVRPFGFKGGYLTELWQIVSRLQSDSGIGKIGIATQSVLYGDADLFANNSEANGNALMYELVKKALQLVKQTSFTTPVDLLHKILPELHKEGKKLTQKEDLDINFVYNALVSVDNASWLVYAAENNFSGFDSMIPETYQKTLSHRNDKIAVMYQIPYGMPMEDLKKAAEQGYFVFKIKTGFPGTQTEMLAADMARLTQIHNTLKNLRTDHTANGKLIYTMDANARYQKKETLLKYLDHAKKIGAFDQILLYEEPLNIENEEDMRDVGITVAADESVHDEAAALKRLDQGYTALVLKGIAKTLSMSMKIAKLASDRNIPCLCADLTVNPILIDWHKNLAAHLAPFPRVGMGLMETNGDMNYSNWKNMQNYHPAAGAEWTKVKNGVFELTAGFYERSGGIFEPSTHYEGILSGNK